MAEAASDVLVLVAPDRRADDGRRLVAVTPRYVLIERRVDGVKMRIGVPIDAFCGVAVRASDIGGEPQHVVTLVHRDADLCVALETGEDANAMAGRQRFWAGTLGTSLFPSASVARPALRGRGTTLAARRPQALVRRKPGDLGRLATVFDPGAEIIGYE
jgi:hypothetical protein